MKTEKRETTDVSSRLGELKKEFAQGQAELIELDKRRQELRDGLLRVAGAIQVLEEFTANDAEVSSQPETDIRNNQAKPK